MGNVIDSCLEGLNCYLNMRSLILVWKYVVELIIIGMLSKNVEATC